MLTVRQLMQSKGAETYSIGPNATVFQALQLMAEKNVGAVMVVDNGQILGIFTERDYARKIILKGKCSLETSLSENMTSEMVTIHPEQSLEDCMKLMTKWHIRHLPVMAEGRLVGMISMRDVVEAILAAKDNTIEHLESYIFGEEYRR